MATDSVIERAARALCDLASEDADESLEMSDGKQMLRWEYEARKVRTVLTAIREPSLEMLSAPVAQDGDWSNERDLFWKGMIDAALEE